MTDELVAIHVRFANDGSVAEISQRPAPLSPQQWFNALSGRRGAGRVSRFGGGAWPLPRLAGAHRIGASQGRRGGCGLVALEISM